VVYGSVALTVIGGIPGNVIGVVMGIPGMLGIVTGIPGILGAGCGKLVVSVVAVLMTEGTTPLAVAMVSIPLRGGIGNK